MSSLDTCYAPCVCDGSEPGDDSSARSSPEPDGLDAWSSIPGLTLPMREFVALAISSFMPLITSEDGAVYPSISVERTDGKRFMIAVTAGTGEEGEQVGEPDVIKARGFLARMHAEPEIRLAALTYDAVLRSSPDGTRQSVVVAEVIGGGIVHVFIQPYAVSGGVAASVGSLGYVQSARWSDAHDPQRRERGPWRPAQGPSPEA